jgi:hypothetical protein
VPGVMLVVPAAVCHLFGCVQMPPMTTC